MVGRWAVGKPSCQPGQGPPGRPRVPREHHKEQKPRVEALQDRDAVSPAGGKKV